MNGEGEGGDQVQGETEEESAEGMGDGGMTVDGEKHT